MGELCETYLGPEYLPGERISDIYLQGEEFEPILSPHLAPYIARFTKEHGDIFYIKYNERDFFIRPLHMEEYRILCKMRMYFDPEIGVTKERAKINTIDIYEIFGQCILYPEDINNDPTIPAGIPDMLIETAIQYSGWDNYSDIIVSQNHGRNTFSSDLLEQMTAFVLRAFPGKTAKDLVNKNIIDIMKLLAAAEAILDSPFEIKQKETQSEGSKIATEVMIKEDLNEMRKMGIGNSPLEV